jgi:hypothetical protein
VGNSAATPNFDRAAGRQLSSVRQRGQQSQRFLHKQSKWQGKHEQEREEGKERPWRMENMRAGNDKAAEVGPLDIVSDDLWGSQLIYWELSNVGMWGGDFSPPPACICTRIEASIDVSDARPRVKVLTQCSLPVWRQSCTQSTHSPAQ